MGGKKEWKDEYSIGILRVDYQHKYFLELINWLGENLYLTDDLAMRQRYVEEVVRYAKFHFISEENFMCAIGYGEMEAHKALHTQLIERLNYHILRLELNREDLPEFITFLEEWFINHTVNEDKKIALHVAAQE